MKRLVYEGNLRFPYGFHTGDGRRLAASDQPLFRAPDGSVILAGTSLAGVLRADLGRLLRAAGGPDEQCARRPNCKCVVCRLMGPRALRMRKEEGSDAALRASRLHVVGGRSEGRPAVRVRDRVGIDRRTRTAAARRKYDLEVVEGPLDLPFTLRIDEPEADELRYLEAVLRRLSAGWLFLGGKTGSGLGRAELTRLERTEIELSRPESLVAHLLGEALTAGGETQVLVGGGEDGWVGEWELGARGEEHGPASESVGDAQTAGPQPPGAGDWAQIRLALEIDLPWGFLVHDPAEALARGYDHAYARRVDGSPLLSGSSLRGALRSRAEQILRTVAGRGGACDLHTAGKSCHERIEKENQARKERHRTPLKLAEELSWLCPACRVFGSGRLVSSIKLTDFYPVAGREGSRRRQEQVAIDRFTGGAAAGAKFNSELADGVTFAGEIHVELGSSRLETWGLGLLALVLRDFLWEDVPLGFGTARGFNEYRVRLTGIDRFWIEAPGALEGLGSDLPDAAGARSFRSAPGQPLDSPAVVEALVGPRLAQRLASWVKVLHSYLERRLPGPAERSKAESGEVS